MGKESKVLFSVFWDSQGVIYWEMLDYNRTVNRRCIHKTVPKTGCRFKALKEQQAKQRETAQDEVNCRSSLIFKKFCKRVDESE